MKRCAFLTLADPTGFTIDDNLAYAPLAELGWSVEAIPWRQSEVDWEAFDAAIIRSTWDYSDHPGDFLAALDEIELSGTPLFNPAKLVRWNLHKTYLRELESRGVAIVPTIWRERLEPGDLGALLEDVGSDEAVLKPVVGASAEGVYRVNRQNVESLTDALEARYSDRALMVQPFLHAIPTEGEYSLFFFNGEYSHTILKTPKDADFRVQEEHGGIILSVQPDDALRQAGDIAIRALGESPLYARADFVRSNDGDAFWMIEFELIEPALYFRMDPESPRRFANALNRRMTW